MPFAPNSVHSWPAVLACSSDRVSQSASASGGSGMLPAGKCVVGTSCETPIHAALS